MAPFPDWALLDRFVVRRDDLDVDDLTVAPGTGSGGHAIHVGFQLHAPPRVSRILLRLDAAAEASSSFNDFRVVAAHRDALLLRLSYCIDLRRGRMLCKHRMLDFFLYRAAGTAGKTSRPSLELLPSLDGTTVAEVRARIETEGFVFMTNQHERRANGLDLGVVRRGDKEFAVAELQFSWPPKEPPELHVFCPSRSTKWETKHPPLIPVGCSQDFNSQKMLFYWNADKVLTFGEGTLCWIDYCYGITFCDVFDDKPVLYYKEFPSKVPNLYDNCHGTGWVDACQTVGITSCGTMKYITVVRGDGKITGEFKESSGFTIISWTLRRTAPETMGWDKTDELTSADIWCLDGFENLPRTPLLQFPHVNMDNPNVVSFVLSRRVEGKFYSESWLVSIDLSSKVVRDSHPYSNPELEDTDISRETDFSKWKYWYFESFLPTDFTKYLLSTRTDIRSEPRPRKRKLVEGSKQLELTC